MFSYSFAQIEASAMDWWPSVGPALAWLVGLGMAFMIADFFITRRFGNGGSSGGGSGMSGATARPMKTAKLPSAGKAKEINSWSELEDHARKNNGWEG